MAACIERNVRRISIEFTGKLKERLDLQNMRMYCNLNGKMSLMLGIFPASIGKKYFFALGTIPETEFGFIGRKTTEILKRVYLQNGLCLSY